MNSEGGEIVTYLIAIAFIGMVMLLIVFSVIALPVGLAGAGVVAGYYYWKNNPTTKEEASRKHTLELYETILASYKEVSVEWKLEEEFIPVAEALFEMEIGSGVLEPPPPICNSIEGARYRDRLSKLGSVSQVNADAVIEVIYDCIDSINPPELPEEANVPIRYLLNDLNSSVDSCIRVIFRSDYFNTMRTTLNRNLNALGTPTVFPAQYTGDDVVEAYLADTPLQELFEVDMPFGFPREKYYEHGLITAGTGSGKTQLITWFIKNELVSLLRSECSIIVMDSQKELFDTLLNIDMPMDKIIHIDPSDIQFPIPISLFDMGMSRKSQYPAADQERVVNGAIEVLRFVIGGILGAAMTTKQETLFNFVIRLLILIPDSTLHTMREILEEEGPPPYQEYIAQLSPTAQTFFKNQFPNRKEYGETKSQVVRRLYDVLEVGVFDRMFSQAGSKFDLFEEMGKGKLILLDTDKSLLKDSGTELLGRLYLAMLNIAIQERALVKNRKPVYFFCDESHDYVKNNSDTTITTMLEQARKMNVGTFWITQHLGQLEPKMRASFMANTSIKMCSGVSVNDATRLSKEMRTSTDFINAQPALTFATYIKGVTGTAIPLEIPYGCVSSLPQRTKEGREELRDYIREKYAKPKNQPEEPEDVQDAAPPEEHDPETDYVVYKEKPVIKPDDDFEPL